MKKNVRIISAAAAALLAVAPVVGSTVNVNADAQIGGTTSNNTKPSATTSTGTEKNPIAASISGGLLINSSDAVNKYETSSTITNNVKLSVGSIAGVETSSIKVVNSKGEKVTSFTAGQEYKVVANVSISGLEAGKYYKFNTNGNPVKASTYGTLDNVEVRLSLTAYDPSAPGVPYFADNNGAILSNGAIVPLANGVSVTNGETVGNILKAAKDQVNFRDSVTSSVNNSDITTTASDVIDELKKQGITVSGSGDSAKVTITSGGFNVTLTGRTTSNNKTATVKVPFVVATTPVTDAPIISVATKTNGEATFGSAKAPVNGTYYQVAQGSNFNPTNFTTNDGTEVKFSAVQSKSNNQAANLTANPSSVDTSETGRFYRVTLTATNSANKTSKTNYYVLVVSNGQQEVYIDAPTYTIYGENVISNGNTIKAGTKVYVGEETKTIGNITYSKVSTKSKTDANNGNTWIQSSALMKPQVTEKTETKTVMVESRAYDKDGNYLNHNFETYSDIDIVPTVVTIKGKTYYKVGDKYKVDGKDTYVRVTNITGTKRTLKHNAYIYWSSYRRTPGTTKYYKGQTITTYGASYKFKNGKRYYRIEGCRDNNKRYIKTVNFY